MTPESLRLERTGLHVRWADAEARLDGTLCCAAVAAAAIAACPFRPTAPPQPDTRVTDLSPVGAYGVQSHFDDGHDRTTGAGCEVG